MNDLRFHVNVSPLLPPQKDSEPSHLVSPYHEVDAYIWMLVEIVLNVVYHIIKRQWLSAVRMRERFCWQ